VEKPFIKETYPTLGTGGMEPEMVEKVCFPKFLLAVVKG
jgi:hypothetical protein